MLSPRLLRVVTFHALGPDGTLDAVLRSEVLPQLLGEPAVVEVWQGRRGSAEGNHVLVSTWSGDPVPTVGDPADVALLRCARVEAVGGVQIVAVDQLEVAVHATFGRPEPARVLRVFHGTTRPGELADYVDEARAGMTEDARINDGLVSFVLAHDGGEAFVSASTWTSWAAIESATGGNTRQPFTTRQPRRLASFRIAHLELLPETPVHRTSPAGERVEAAS